LPLSRLHFRECVGIEDLIPEELICAAVKLTRPRFGDDVDLPGCVPPIFGAVMISKNLELGDGIDARVVEQSQVGATINVIHAIDCEAVLARPAAIDRKRDGVGLS
jgi:hypothetical protein